MISIMSDVQLSAELSLFSFFAKRMYSFSFSYENIIDFC